MAADKRTSQDSASKTKAFRFGRGSGAGRVKPKTSRVALEETALATRGPDIPEDIADAADAYLRELGAPLGALEASLEDQADWLANRIVEFNKASREDHHKTIAAAYAVYASSRSNEFAKLAVAKAAALKGVEISKRKCALRIIIELHVSYGTSDDPKTRRRINNLYSRDVGAVTHLIKRGIPANQLLDLSRQKGEGLDIWNRHNGEMQQISIKGNLSKKNASGEQRLTLDHSNMKLNDNILIWGKMSATGKVIIKKQIVLDNESEGHINGTFELFEVCNKIK